MLRISEVYTSFQGEGPRVGIPTVFVRFAGCNLKCPGWPCDTQHAIDPERYRDEWKLKEVDDLVGQVTKEIKATGASNVCLTGGEPFLQNKLELQQFVHSLAFSTANFEAFTNGTIEWPVWSLHLVRFIMDWKLEGSGESVRGSDEVLKNAHQLCQGDAVKFTIRHRADFEEAVDVWKSFFVRKGTVGPQVFCGPVWDLLEPAAVAEWILREQLPWRLNIQTHKYVFGDVRGI